MKRLWWGVALAAAALLGTPAFADEPRSPTAPPPRASPPPEAGKTVSPNRFEPSILPVIANDPDVGFKFGLFTQIARYRDRAEPYAWRLQVAGVLSAKEGATGVELPYRALTLRLDIPEIIGKDTRLFTELVYARTTNLGYFGLGNTSVGVPRWLAYEPGSDEYVRARRYYQLDGIQHELSAALLQRFTASWRFYGGVRIRWLEMGAFDGSLLAQHLESGPGGDRRIDGIGTSVYPLLFAGLVYDTRDHEAVPTRGGFHEMTLRCSTSGFSDGGWCGATVALRGYLPILGRRLHLAGRLLGDVLYGHPPLFELARVGGLQQTWGPGGGLSVRGLPQGRFQGNTKLVANFEIRSFFWPFRLGSQRFEVGVVAFFDAGRVWTNTLDTVPALDGSGLALRFGTGGGLRLRWGDSLVIRIDVSYSPVASDLGSAVGLHMDVEPVF